MKKFLLKLINYGGTRENLSKTHFDSDQQDQAKLARERHQQIMESRGDKKYVSERTTEPPPTEAEILGPSESKPEESHE